MKEKKTNRFDIGALIAKSLQGRLSGEEADRLADWLAQSEANRQLLESIRADNRIGEEVDFISGLDMDRAWKAVRNKRKANVRAKKLKWVSWAAAILVIGVSSFWTLGTWWKDHHPNIQLVSRFGEDLLPASQQATLVLPSGKRIALAGDQALDAHDSIQLVSRAGELRYLGISANDLSQSAQVYNTLIVPKAGMFRLVLPDSSRVWLNAASKLRFPVSFSEKERRVFLEGEAFFEVKEAIQKPFVVEMDDTEVTVLGTSFNVSTFAETATTLVSGSVRITAGSQTQVMHPGQLARVVDGGLEITQADLEKTLSWKNGEFVFNQDRIKDILEELSRWYDFEVTYVGNIPEKEYTGGMARSERLSTVLDMLAYVFHADFQIEGKTVMVSFEPEVI